MLRALAKDGSIYTVANFLTKGFSFLLLPFYTHVFLKSTVGIIDILSVFSLFMTSLVCFQLNQGMGRYVADPDQSEDSQIKYGSSAIWFTSFSYLLFATLLVIFPDYFIDLLSADTKVPKSTFRYAVIGMSLTGIVYFIGVYLRFMRRSKAFALITFSHGFLTTALIFLFIIKFKLGLNSVYIAPIVSGPIIIVIQLMVIKDKLKLTIDWNKIKELFVYSMPLVPASIAYVVLNFTDRLFIKEYLSFEELGTYGIAAKFSSIIQIIILGVSAALGPIAYQRAVDDSIKPELSRVFRLFIAFGMLGVLTLSLFSFETLYLLTPPEYYEAKDVMPILYFSAFFGGFSMFSIGLHLKKKTNVIAVVVILTSLLNVGLNYVLISKFQLYGAAIATLISIFINNIALVYFSQKYFKLHFHYRTIGVVFLLVSISVYFGCYVLPGLKLNLFIVIALKLLLISIFAVTLFYIKLVNPRNPFKKT
ncbi:MAG: oligosaccharide flippase family protein [Crocinitomicaceae bacterium]